jgi:hypothetical protein
MHGLQRFSAMLELPVSRVMMKSRKKQKKNSH